MIYEPLLEVKEKKSKYRYCIDAINITLAFSTTIFTFLTYQYLKAIADGIKDSDIKEVVDIFEGLKECVEEAGFC